MVWVPVINMRWSGHLLGIREGEEGGLGIREGEGGRLGHKGGGGREAWA